MTSLSQAKLLHIVKLVSLSWGRPQLSIILLQFLAEDSRHEGWEHNAEEDCVGGQQEYHRVPAEWETFLCGEEKCVRTGSEGACVCVMGWRGAGVRDE